MRRRSLVGSAAGVLTISLVACSSTLSESSSPATATYAEGLGAPNYIFPMITFAYYTVANIEQFERLSYRSLYWIGQNASPTIDKKMSLADLPTYSDGNTVVTIHLRNYNWSDGTPVTSRDVAFWINLLKANKTSFAAYTPGEFPDNLKSYKIVSAKEIVLTLTGPFNPTWFTYDQLSQITPLPVHAWDKTSAAGKAGNYDETPSGAVKVFNFLTAQSKDISTYGTNPLWHVVDGPWKMVSYQSSGYVKFAANAAYSGPDNHKLKYFVEEPFTSEISEVNVLRSGHALSFGWLPLQDSSQAKALASQSYTTVPSSSWGINYFALNYNNPTDGPILSQPYIRQAMQSLVNEKAYIKGPFQGYGEIAYGPIPSQPANPFVDSYERAGPWPYSPATAARLLRDHGWTVRPNGVTTCASPGTGTGHCGAGVPSGAKLVFSLASVAGVESLTEELEAFKSSLSQVGMVVNVRTSGANTNIVPCKPSQASCSWQLGVSGWLYGVDPYPTGDQLFATGSGSNFTNLSIATLDHIIDATVHTNTSLTTYENYMADNVPVIWLPMSDGINEIASNLHGATPVSPFGSLNPEQWYFTK